MLESRAPGVSTKAVACAVSCTALPSERRRGRPPCEKRVEQREPTRRPTALAEAAMATISTALLVRADQKAAKSTVKSLGGCWVGPPLNGWCFPVEQREALSKALSEAGICVDGAKAAASSAAPCVQPSVNANASLHVKKHKRAVLVTGDTLQVKVQLQGLGGRWNRTLGGWIFRPGQHEEVVALLRKDSTNAVVDVFSTSGGDFAGDDDEQGADDDAGGDAGGDRAKIEVKYVDATAKRDIGDDDEVEDEEPLAMRRQANIPKTAAAASSSKAAATAKRQRVASEEGQNSEDDFL